MGAAAYFVVNPRAGNGSVGRRWPALADQARRVLGEIDAGLTSGPMEACGLTRRAVEGGHRLVVAVGGDGTLNEVVNGYLREDGTPAAPDAALALLPAGTGGDFRRTAGIPGEWTQALAHLAAAPVRRIDAGRLSFTDHSGRPVVRHFVNIASFGVSGAVDAAVNESTKIFGGKASFAIGSLKALSHYRDAVVRLSVDGAAAETVRVTTLAVANGAYFGGGMWVAPQARLDDGRFDCTLWSGYGLLDFVLRAKMIYDGSHVKDARTRCFRAQRVRAESDVTVLLDVDGEAPGRLPAEFEVLPGAIGLKA